MDFFDYIISRNDAQEENPGRLSSYRQAAELNCMCWNGLDMSFIEPYLDENMVWEGGTPHRVINGKAGFLKLMSQVFNSLQFSKRSYKADVDGSGDHAVAIVTVDGEYQDMMHRLKIEDGLIKVLISLYRYQVYHCNRYHASAAIGTVRIAANGTMIIGSA